MGQLQKFPPTPPEAFIPLVFSFADFLGAGVEISAVKGVSIASTAGVDTSPGDRLYGTSGVDAGQRVVHWLKYPVLGEVYEIRATIVADDMREWSVTGLLTCAKV